MRKHVMKKNNYKSYISASITLVVMVMLLLAGPGQALELALENLSSTAPTVGSTVTVDARINIKDNELLAEIPDIDLYINGTVVCSFDANTGAGCGDQNISIEVLTTSEIEYGYGYDEGYGYGTYSPGGYGYIDVNDADNEFSYRLSFDTNTFGVVGETYTLKIALTLGSTTHESEGEASFTIQAATPATETSTSSSGMASTYTVSEETLQQGFTRWLLGGHKVKFTLQELPHTITLNEVTSTGVSVTVASEPQTKFVNLGDEWEVDVSGDNVVDLLIKVNEISGTRALLEIREIDGTTTTIVADDSDTETPTTTTTDDNTAVDTTSTDVEAEDVEEESSSMWIWIILILVALAVILFFVFKNKEN
ncbi:MAG: hypothetical protein AB7V77_04695 [Candidatus Woesearchaeota archaeon]